MITFLAALYNEEEEVLDFFKHVAPYVDGFAVVDDGSTDRTRELLRNIKAFVNEGGIDSFQYKTIEHTGLPETVKNEALKLVPDGSWVLMLDADERIQPLILQDIRLWTSNGSKGVDYVYLRQVESVDGENVREFQKCKVFRKEAVSFPLDNIHADDKFEGTGAYRADWIVSHRKSSSKQITREIEYLATYRRLLDTGKIDEGRYNWLIGLHHFVKPHN